MDDMHHTQNATFSDDDVSLTSIDAEFMQCALEQARRAGAIGEVPIGAIVVHEGVIVATGYNRREIDRSPVAHAEHIALVEASRRLDRWRLSDCTVYVTLEPCIMCAGLMHQSRIARCVYGAYDPKAGALGTLYTIHSDERLNHTFEVTSGICEEECAGLLQKFFLDVRARKQAEKQRLDDAGIDDLTETR
jgi:tRNA(adenine34) deaminase